MKKIIYLLAAVIGMFACNDDKVEYIPQEQLEVTQSDVDFTATGGEGTIRIANGSAGMEASSDADWCKVTAQSAQGVTFTVTANARLQSRSAVLSLKDGQKQAKIAVTQAGFVAEFEENVFFPYAGNASFSKLLSCEGDITIHATVDPSASSWLSCKEAAGGYVVSAASNVGEVARMGKVTLQAGELAKDYFFLQYGDNLSGSWIASYTNSTGEGVTEPCTITKNDTTNYLQFVFGQTGYGGLALYEDGGLKIPYPQKIGTANGYTLYWGGYTAAGQPAISKQATLQLTPILIKDGQWGFSFVDDGSYGESVIYPALWAVSSSGEIAGYWELFRTLTLIRQ